VTDGRTDSQTHDESIFRAIVASRGKKLINPVTVTVSSFSLFQKVHLLRPPNHLFRRKVQCFMTRERTKNTAQNLPNTPFQIKNTFFWERGPAFRPFSCGEGYLYPSTHILPLVLHQVFRIHLCVPRIPASFTPLAKSDTASRCIKVSD